MMKCWLCLLFLIYSYNVYASTDETNQAVQTSPTFISKLIGCPAPELRIHYGMWSKHATNKDRNNQNDLFGFSYKGLFLGTLVNSYYIRAYAAGLQRFWFTKPISVKHDVNYQFGYRLGLVTGYQGHDLTGIKKLKDSRVIPFVQLIFDLNWKHLGLEFSTPDPYVVSMGFYIRF